MTTTQIYVLLSFTECKAICVKNIVNILRICSQHIIKDASVIKNLKSVDSMSASSVFKWFFPKFLHRSLSSNKLTCQHIETVFYVLSCKRAQSLQKEKQMIPHTSGTRSLTAGCSLFQSHVDRSQLHSGNCIWLQKSFKVLVENSRGDWNCSNMC